MLKKDKKSSAGHNFLRGLPRANQDQQAPDRRAKKCPLDSWDNVEARRLFEQKHASIKIAT